MVDQGYMLPNGIKVSATEITNSNVGLYITCNRYICCINMLNGLIFSAHMSNDCEHWYDIKPDLLIYVDFLNTLAGFVERLQNCVSLKDANAVIDIEYSDLKNDFESFINKVHQIS